ncbi:MAG: BatA domain-containing protein, partial [Planctomycetota bacterium]
MTWLNFGILGIGGALLSIPILLHFLMQPKPKEMVFPAMRFLLERQHANRSRMRIRHFLLLLMRCLLIGLLAIALAGPSVASEDYSNWLTLGGIGFSGIMVGIVLLLASFRQPRSLPLLAILGALFLGHLGVGGWMVSKVINSESANLIGNDQAPVAALVVVDTSPRMDYRNQNLTRLEQAKEFGQWLIRQFPSDSQVCVLATDNDRPFFSVDVGAAERRLDKLEITFSPISIPETLNDGLGILEKAQQERKEIYLISDLTRAGWSESNSKTLIRKLKKDEATSLFVIDVGIENPTNFSLDPLNLSDVEITAEGKFSIGSMLRRKGNAAQRTVKMSIERPDRSRPVVRDDKVIFPDSDLHSQTLTKEIRENASVPVKFTFGDQLELGTYHGSVEIEGQDGLGFDNQRFFTIRVGQVKKVLVIYPENVNPIVIPSLLAPYDKVESGTARYDVEQVEQSEFVEAGVDLEDYDAVFVLDPQPVDDQTWGIFESYVTSGGGLSIFLGYNAASGGLADPSFSTKSAARVLTGNLDRQWLSDEDNPDLFLSPAELTHPVFSLVRDNPTSVLWNRFPIFIHWGLDPVENEELPTQTLLRYSNREPAVIERELGEGKILVMTTPITEYGNVRGRKMWNSLLTGKPLPAFMLLTGIANYLTQTDSEFLNVQVGQTVSFENSLREYPETYQAFSPDEERLPSRVNSVSDQIRFRVTDQPGHYRLK